MNLEEQKTMTMIMNDVTAFELKLTLFLIKNITFFYIHKIYNMVIFYFDLCTMFLIN